MRLGLGLSISKNNGKFAGVGNAFVNAFKARVLGDSGTFEGESFLTAIVNALASFWASFTLFTTANAFKTSKLYSIIPTSGVGDIAYTRSSTATRVNQNGLIETMAANVPRIDWTYGFPVMLSETAATNIVSNSNGFTAFTAQNMLSVTANAATSPLGTQTATRLIPDTSSNQHRIFAAFTNTTANAISLYVKPNGYNYFSFGVGGGLVGSGLIFNLIGNGSITGSDASYTGTISYNAITGYYRCTMASLAIGTSINVFLIVRNAASTANYAGNGTSGIDIWNLQIEAGAYSTSAIITTGSQITRTADSSNTTGLSSLIGQSEGTIYAEILVTQKTNDYTLAALAPTGQNPSNVLLLKVTSTGAVQAVVYGLAGFSLSMLSSALVLNSVNKIAFAYKSGNSALYINGAQIASDATTFSFSATINAVRLLDVGYYTGGGQQAVKSIGIVATRLSNSQLATLTT
jgi:hypothetical protein